MLMVPPRLGGVSPYSASTSSCRGGQSMIPVTPYCSMSSHVARSRDGVESPFSDTEISAYSRPHPPGSSQHRSLRRRTRVHEEWITVSLWQRHSNLHNNEPGTRGRLTVTDGEWLLGPPDAVLPGLLVN